MTGIQIATVIISAASIAMSIAAFVITAYWSIRSRR